MQGLTSPSNYPEVSSALIHPFTNPVADLIGLPRQFARAQGQHLYDSSGRAFLDAFAGLWCVNLGYGRDDLVAAAAAEMKRLSFHSIFWGQASEAASRLADELVEVLPDGLTRILFANTGSEANDIAVRILHYVAHSSGQPQRKNILSFEASYHGNTYLSSGTTGIPSVHAKSEAPFGFQHKVPLPLARAPWRHRETAKVISETVASLEATIEGLNPETIAALFVEPILGTVGVVVPPEGWLKAVEDVCRRYDIALVVDEVMTGFCRTGAMFATTSENVRPDMLVMAKGLTSAYVPMSAVALSDALFTRLVQAVERGASLPLGSTYSGHPVAAATARCALAAYRNEDIARHAQQMGERLHAGLADVAAHHSIVGDLRSRGLVAGLHLFADGQERLAAAPATDRPFALRRIAYAHGLLVRVFPGDVIGIAPPLTITPEEVDDLTDRIDAMLHEAAALFRNRAA